MILQAAARAVEQAKEFGIRDLKINTDSNFLINGKLVFEY